MDEDYQRCRFSITCETTDLAVVHCLRALCQYAEKGVKGQIAWGGSTESAWRKAGNRITLRFSSPAFRDDFIQQTDRLLPRGSWREVDRNDFDPAVRRRA